ncbi:MAG: AmmeMemoRadiSam system radical SAM enzyme [Candidatus Altiarchaeota archaeon]
MHEALLQSPDAGKAVRCAMCAHRCTIPDGRRGICAVRENRGGTLYSLVWGKPCAANPDPIEKKPLYHFLPGSKAYSIATPGCNFRCKNCQNWEISQMTRDGGEIVGEEVEPKEIVEGAKATGCSSIAYTYTEPTIFMEYALDVSKLAAKDGLRNVFVSNGYMTDDSVGLIAPYLHADNVDLKSFSDRFYRENCGGSLEPVLSTLKDLMRRGVWVEVTTLIIPTLNDGQEELGQIAGFIASELGDHVPWHVSAFHPDYKLGGIPATGVNAVEKAVKLGRDAGLKYVYAGNVPHGRFEDTCCPGCGELLIERHGFSIVRNRMAEGACPGCRRPAEGVWS